MTSMLCLAVMFALTTLAATQPSHSHFRRVSPQRDSSSSDEPVITMSTDQLFSDQPDKLAEGSGSEEIYDFVEGPQEHGNNQPDTIDTSDTPLTGADVNKNSSSEAADSSKSVFSYNFRTSNNRVQQASGHEKKIGKSTIVAMKGSYSYETLGEHGEKLLVKVDWTADETGYHPIVSIRPL